MTHDCNYVAGRMAAETQNVESKVAEDVKLDEAPLSTPVSLELLSLVSEWRAQHGLKHEDYIRYRRYNINV